MSYSIRKHRKQMTPREIFTIEQRVHSLIDFSVSLHTRQRMFDKGVGEQDIRRAVRTGKVIEVSNVAGDTRVLMRLDREGQDSVCAVISLRDFELKTAWKNHPRDNHDEAHPNFYLWKTDLTKLAA